jgi:glycosyltransferase involved in cell wall biosynthesis
MAELVTDHQTGRLFESGNADELAQVVQELASDVSVRSQLRLQARREYVDRYTPTQNYRMLMEIYDRALGALGSATHNSLKLGADS